MIKAIPEKRRPIPEGQSFVAFGHSADGFPFAWHYHPEVELTFIDAGAGTRYVGDSVLPFGPKDLVLLGSNLPHTWASDVRSSGEALHRAVVVHFPKDLFASKAPEFDSINKLVARAERGCAFDGKAAGLVAPLIRALPKKPGLEAWIQLAAILNLLAEARPVALLASPGYAPALRKDSLLRLERAIAYIEQHADSSDLTLRDVAKAANFTPPAFSRFFRRMTGRTPIAHINHTRIGLSCRMLIESDRSISEIAYACGYDNLANFNRRFRAIKRTTPSAFRRQYERPLIVR